MAGRGGFQWNDAMSARLRDLWCVDAKSAAAIATKMSAEFRLSLSRNAVIGRVHRMRLVRDSHPPRTCIAHVRKPEPKPKPAAAATRAAKPAKPDDAKLRAIVAEHGPTARETRHARAEVKAATRSTVDDRRAAVEWLASIGHGECRWPGDWARCGQRATPARPYCAQHHAQSITATE